MIENGSQVAATESSFVLCEVVYELYSQLRDAVLYALFCLQ
jgi:hypothetical protein